MDVEQNKYQEYRKSLTCKVIEMATTHHLLEEKASARIRSF